MSSRRAGGRGQFRPLISAVRRTPGDAEVEVTLDQDGWIADGVAQVQDGDLLSAAGRATCMAASALLPDAVVLRLDTIQHLRAEEWSREMVLAGVTLLVDDAEVGDDLLGAALVRTDVLVAAVRATLDGLTRRLSRYVAP